MSESLFIQITILFSFIVIAINTRINKTPNSKPSQLLHCDSLLPIDSIPAIFILLFYAVPFFLNSSSSSSRPDTEISIPFVALLIILGFYIVLTIPFLILVTSNRWKNIYIPKKNFSFLKKLLIAFIAVLCFYGLLLIYNRFPINDWLVSLFSAKDEQDAVMVLKNSVGFTQIWMVISAVILAPIVEEILFRGTLYPVLCRFGNSRFIAAFATSLFFSVIHGNVISLIPLTLLSLLFIGLQESTKSLITPILAHALFNLINTISILFLR